MNLSLLFPAGLLALAALLLPLLLHLRRRPEARPTDFAALRWLREKLRPRQRLQLDEWLLLLLRLLLVACIALLFAQPVWTAHGVGRPWVLVSTQLDAAAVRKLQAQDAPKFPREAQWHWLAPGFPGFDTPPPAGKQATASLLREADAQLAPKAALTVLLPEVLDGLDGERPRLARAVDWRVLHGAPRVEKKSARNPPGSVAIRYSPERTDALRYVRAAAVANGHAVDVGALDRPLPSDSQAVLWLSAGPVPEALREWPAKGGTLLLDAQAKLLPPNAGQVIWRDDSGTVLMRSAALGRGRVLQWQRDLQPAQLPGLLDASFAARFEAWIQAPPPAPARASAQALRPLTGARKYPRQPSSLDGGLLWLAVLLFAAERCLATRRARGVLR